MAMMSAEKSRITLWYTRRKGVVRGPYHRNQITRYVLLGRICKTDEVRPDSDDWQELSAYPELIPEVMKLPPGAEDRQQLLMARLCEDERQAGDRRERAPNLPQGIREQRSGRERRQPESAEVFRHRELRYQVSHEAQANGNRYRYPLVVSVLVMLGFLASYLL
jgi:hypothetical protein